MLAQLIQKPRFLVFLGLCLLALDLSSKWFATSWFTANPPPLFFTPVVFLLSHNPGIAFSFFAESGELGRWLLVLFTTAILGVLIHWAVKLHRTSAEKPWPLLGLVWIIAGTIGNLIERIFFGTVTDFMTLQAGSLAWPTVFNLADMFIMGGAILACFTWPKSIPTEKKQNSITTAARQ